MLRLCDNPPMLPPGAQTLSELSGRWWAAHTKARFEKIFAWELLERRIGYYLPMVARTRISGGRRRRVLLPLFPSYVFLCGTSEDRYTALTTDRLCQVVEIVDQERFVEEISEVEKAVAGKTEVWLYPDLVPGRRCRIICGPLKGVEGTILELKTRARILLRVSALGTSVLVEVDRDFVAVNDDHLGPARAV